MKFLQAHRLNAGLLTILLAMSWLLLGLFALFVPYSFILMQFSMLVPAVVQAAGLAFASHWRTSDRPLRAATTLVLSPIIGLGGMIALQEALR